MFRRKGAMTIFCTHEVRGARVAPLSDFACWTLALIDRSLLEESKSEGRVSTSLCDRRPKGERATAADTRRERSSRGLRWASL